jgi:hypothetical protein
MISQQPITSVQYVVFSYLGGLKIRNITSGLESGTSFNFLTR